MVIDEYLVKLGVVGDVSKAKEYREGLLAIGETATKVLGLVTGAIGALGAYFADAVGDLDDLGDMAKNTGTSVAFIQEFGYAAAQTGSSVDAARESVRGLARMMGEAANGVGKGAKLMDKFGISVKNSDGSMRDMGDVIGQIQAKMAKMTPQQQGSFLSKMGIDASMRQVLSLTTEEFQKLTDAANEWGTNTEEQADAASAIDNRFKDLRFGMQQFRTLVGLSLIPTMDRLIGSFKAWFKENRSLIQDGLMKMFTVMGYVIQVGTNFVSFMGGWRNTLLLLVGVYALLNRELIANAAAMLASPITWIILGVGALLLLIDDLMTYMEGGDSQFAAFWEPFLGYVAQAWGYLQGFIPAAISLFDQLVDAGSGLVDAIAPFAEAIVELGSTIIEAFTPTVEFLSLVFGDTLVAVFNTLGAAGKLAFQLIIDALNILVAAAKGDTEAFGKAFIDVFTHINDFATTVFNSIGTLIDNTLGRGVAYLKSIFGGGTAEAAVVAARNAVGTAAAGASTPVAVGGVWSGKNANVSTTAPAALGGVGAVTLPSATPTGLNAPQQVTATPQPTTIAQHVNINVQSSDPAAAGRETARALQDTARRATANAAPTVVQ